jgi:Vitamin K-dependent gamma-carboxylase
VTSLADTPPFSWLRRSLAGVTAMWSEKADPRGIALCRMLLFWHAARELDAGEYARFMNVGELAWRPHSYFRTFGLHPPSDATARMLCVAYAIAGFLATAGAFYRVTALLTAGLSLYLHGILQNFGKTLHTYHLFSLALVIMAFANAADVWSVDALLRRGLARLKNKEAPRVEPSVEYRWPLLFVGSTILVMYGAAGMSKLYLTGWVWALSDNFRQTLLQGQFDAKPPTQFGVWLADYPTLCQVAALGALIIEASSWVGLVNRTLFWVWGAFVALLQFGIWFLMGVVFGELPTMFAFFLPWNFMLRTVDGWLARARATLAPSA